LGEETAMPRKDKRDRDKKVKDKKGKNRKAKSKREKRARNQPLLEPTVLLKTSKRDLQLYQDENPRIFPEGSIDWDNGIADLRAQVIQIQYDYCRSTSGGDDDEDGDDDDNDDDDNDDDDDDSSSDDGNTKNSSRTPTKSSSRCDNFVSPLRSSSSSGAVTKSPSVADPRALTRLLQPRVDLAKIVASLHNLGDIFERGGTETLRPVLSHLLEKGDVVVICNTHFPPTTGEMTEDALFGSYLLYFYTVYRSKTSDDTRVTLQYLGRSEPMNSTPTPLHSESLHLDQIPRADLVLTCDPNRNWIIGTHEGRKNLRAMFPTASSSNSGGSSRSSGDAGSKHRDSGGSQRGGRDNGGSGGKSKDRFSFGGGGSEKTRTGKQTVSFHNTDTLTITSDAEEERELLPYLGHCVPPQVAAVETIYWRPCGSGKPLSSPANSTHHQPMICWRTNTEFILINPTRMDTKDVSEVSRKIRDSVIFRGLLYPRRLSIFVTGKGLDFMPLSDVRDTFANLSMSMRNVADLSFRSPVSDPTLWDQTKSEVYLFNEISTSKVLSDTALYGTFIMFGTYLNPTNQWELDPSSPRVADFVAASLNFNPDQKVCSSSDLLSQKVILGKAISHVEMVHTLLRHPGVFLDSFAPIIAALNNPTHIVCNDLFSVPALIWFFEISMAEFYRRVKFHQGSPNVITFRRFLWVAVVEPFVNMTQQVQLSYTVALQSKQMHRLEGLQKKCTVTHEKVSQVLLPPPPKVPENVSLATDNKGTVPVNKKVCKYHLASFLKVPFPDTNKVPECLYNNLPSSCPACPHQDFSKWSKGDLTQLLSVCRGEFNSHGWTKIYSGLVTAVAKMA